MFGFAGCSSLCGVSRSAASRAPAPCASMLLRESSRSSGAASAQGPAVYRESASLTMLVASPSLTRTRTASIPVSSSRRGQRGREKRTMWRRRRLYARRRKRTWCDHVVVSRARMRHVSLSPLRTAAVATLRPRMLDTDSLSDYPLCCRRLDLGAPRHIVSLSPVLTQHECARVSRQPDDDVHSLTLVHTNSPRNDACYCLHVHGVYPCPGRPDTALPSRIKLSSPAWRPHPTSYCAL